jgi:hypothetical protein
MSRDNAFAGSAVRPAAPQERQLGDNLPIINPGAKPTKGGIVQRPASPDAYMTSGIERAMGVQADQMHRRRK